MRADHSTGNGSRSECCIHGSSTSGMRRPSINPRESTATLRATACDRSRPTTRTVGA